jgi:hypothetical protein
MSVAILFLFFSFCTRQQIVVGEWMREVNVNNIGGIATSLTRLFSTRFVIHIDKRRADHRPGRAEDQAAVRRGGADPPLDTLAGPGRARFWRSRGPRSLLFDAPARSRGAAQPPIHLAGRAWVALWPGDGAAVAKKRVGARAFRRDGPWRGALRAARGVALLLERP